MGQIKNIKLHIVTDIKVKKLWICADDFMEDIYMRSSSMDSFGAVTDTEEEDETETEGCKPTLSTRLQNVRVTPYRWFVLTLYSLTAFSNTLVWLSLFTVSDATVAYYRISEAKLIWSSTVVSALQVLVAVPVTFLPSRLGLRTTMIVAAVINAVGACIMIAGTHRAGFAFFVTGQTIVALSASILPQLAPQVSAVWFGEKEQALSTSVGIIIGNAGAAVGFLQPALMITNINPAQNIPFIDRKLKELIYSQAGLCVFMLIMVVFFFKREPLVPPSYSQAVRVTENSLTLHSFKNAYKVLLKDRHYIVCSHAFAFNNLLLITVPIFLNSIVSWKFPYHDALIGWMGFGSIVAGIVGSVVFSIILDKTQQHKKIVMLLGASTLVLWVAFTETLANYDHLPLIITLLVLCLFTFIPFSPVCVDMLVEMTYPIPESMSFVLPITGGRLYSIPVVFVLGYLVEKNCVHLLCLVVAGVMLFTLVFVALPPVRKKRTEAGTSTSQGSRQHLGRSDESLLHVDGI